MENPNPELQLAGEYVKETACHIFLTGKAGTGKTTFLSTIKTTSHKRAIVTAPTGVAAINAGGVTLHSFFQLPFGPFIPGNEDNRSRFRFSREKIRIIKSLDLLIIDEISMVRADVLDGVDNVLRRHRRSNLPFGGVQLLMIGDLFQLPPVVKEAEWKLLAPYYASPYFFSSNALKRTDLVPIELKHIYRQADRRFIELLNRLRNNRLDPPTAQELNTRYVPDFNPAGRDGYITLCTHNRAADAINASRLGALKQKTQRFKAEIDGEFPEHMYPTKASLELKIGAQVMFMRNDPSPEKLYFNGKIGRITRISGDVIKVKCSEDSKEISVEPLTWKNIEYSLDPDTREITEKMVGTFSQYPLKLAWAITIHKSQGLTFDKAVIDARAAFAHGQVYVALSRCRTFEGMVLSSPISTNGIKIDAAVSRFSREIERRTPSEDQLKAAKITYQQQLLLECFNFGRLGDLFRRMAFLLYKNGGLIHVTGIEDIEKLQKKAEKEIIAVGNKFLRQLRELFSESVAPAQDPVILERISKASVYFQEKIRLDLCAHIPNLRMESDNKDLLKKARNSHKRLQEEIEIKLAGVRSCEQGFSPSRYFRVLSKAELDAKGKKEKTGAPAYSEGDIAHPDLFLTLKQWRSRKAQEEGVAHFQVLHQKSLIQIAVELPDTMTALRRIHGIGKKLAERYGEELVAMVCAYRAEHNIKQVSLPAATVKEEKKSPPKKSPKIDTKKITRELFERGLSLPEIAEERGLVLSTIEGHMAHFVEKGDVAVELLLAPEKLCLIEAELSRMPGRSLKEIKQAIVADVSYGEIRLAQAHYKMRNAN